MHGWRIIRGLTLATLVWAAACGARAGGDRVGSPGAEVAGATPVAPVAEPAAAPAPNATPAAELAAELARYFEGEGGAGQESWYGIYLMGQKIGYGRTWARRAAEGEPGRYAAGMEMDLRVRGGGNESEVHIADARWYGGEAPWPLVETRFSQRTPQGSEERRGVASSVGLVVTSVGAPGAPRTLPATSETLMSASAGSFFAGDQLKPGMRAEGASFNWQLERDDLFDVEILRVETSTRAGVETEVAELAMVLRANGLRMTNRVTHDGLILEMNVGVGMRMLLEEREIARSDVKGMDVMGAVLPVKRELGDPRSVRELKLVVRGAGGALPASAGQSVTAGDGDRLEVTLRRGLGDPVTAEARAAGLDSGGDIDADHAAISAKSRALTEGLTSPADKVAALRRFVFKALEKRLATWIPTASAILARGVGDCTEHTTLFVALCRAAGIPARPVFGVAYLGAGSRAFGYHAWAEVELDGRWVPVDPTWDEATADATHLVLGRDLMALAAVLTSSPTLEVVGEPLRD
ncbi:MAG: transglutaminase-like domain-containing protein [Myxococcota bacterium]